MAQLHLNIISPEKSLFDGDIEKVTLPGTSGPFTILPHHAPIISSLKKGVIEYVSVGDNSDGGGKQILEIEAGFIELSNDIVTVCIS